MIFWLGYNERTLRSLQKKHPEVEPEMVRQHYFHALEHTVFGILAMSRDGKVSLEYATDVVNAVEESPRRKIQTGLLAIDRLLNPNC